MERAFLDLASQFLEKHSAEPAPTQPALLPKCIKKPRVMQPAYVGLISKFLQDCTVRAGVVSLKKTKKYYLPVPAVTCGLSLRNLGE